MFELEDGDYEPLSGFPLLWRWTSPAHAELPPGVLERIRPIAGAKATLVAEAALARAAGRDARRLDTAALDEGAVRDWLLGLPVRADEQVIVSWDAQTAVVTPFELVAEHWSDVFYPASDDATVTPLGVEWMLAWHHEEQFEFTVLAPA